MQTVNRPLLRYFGGKWLLAPWIIAYMPPHHLYVEPFGGAASVLLQKSPAYSEVYNDLDGDVVNLFRVLQTSAPELERLLRVTPFARSEFQLAYQPSTDPVERARRLLIRSWLAHGANGAFQKTGFRTNITRTRNTCPAQDWRRWVDHLDMFVERLRGVTVEERPASEVIRGHDSPETLFYVDPPYPHETRQSTRYRHEMNDTDHRVLADQLHNVKGMVLLSGYPGALYEQLYSDWSCVTQATHADGHGERTECLWSNPAALAAMPTHSQLHLIDA